MEEGSESCEAVECTRNVLASRTNGLVLYTLTRVLSCVKLAITGKCTCIAVLTSFTLTEII